ncbi:MAG: trypsin-like peptidase domain-containing protein [Planctomycetota bacterium]
MNKSSSQIVLLAFLLLMTPFATWAAEPGGLELDPVVAEAEAKRIAAIARATPSAVSVFIPGGGGGGSGVLISPEGYALTNFHVTSPAGTFMRCGLSDGQVYDAVLVGLDPVGDLAMIKLLGRDDFPYASFADSLKARPGDWCMVIGNPFLLATNLQPTVTWGILSGVGRYQYPAGTLLEYADCLQTDASVNPGNSGGPIYNDQGDLLGVVGRCSFEKRGRVNVGVGYAISINQARNFLGYLRSGRVVDHATLGATVSTDPDGGVVVSNILTSSDAYRRGMRYNSEVLEIDGRPVSTANEVQNVLGTIPADWRVMVAFREDGKTIRVPVRLRSVHRRDELIEKMGSALPPPPPVPDSPPDEDSPEKDEEGEKEAEPEKPRGRRPPSPHGASGPKQKKTIPEAAAKLIEERQSYANYYFNRLEQERFYDQLVALGDDETVGTERWQISGKTPDGDTCTLLVQDGKYAMDTGQFAYSASSKNELFDAVDQDSVAGMLPALDAWRKMIALGPKQFGDVYYKGTMPLSGQRPLRDCTVGIDGEMEVRWLMHPESKLLECIEVIADRDSDPAELWISWEGGKIAGLKLVYGVETALEFTLESWQRGESEE